MRISYITLCKSKRVLKWFCVILLLCIVLNILTNLFAFNIPDKVADSKSELSVMCYNVKCRDSLYKDNQMEIAKLILKESPDVVFLCEFHRSKSKKLDSIMRQSGEYKRFRLRLDHILYDKSRLKLNKMKVLESDLSDHNALIANFSFI